MGKRGEKVVDASSESATVLEDLVLMIVEALVDNADAVEVQVIPTSYKYIVEVRVDPNDVGQVVGTGGSVAKAIRTILAAYSGRVGVKCEYVNVTEREKRERGVA